MEKKSDVRANRHSDCKFLPYNGRERDFRVTLFLARIPAKLLGKQAVAVCRTLAPGGLPGRPAGGTDMCAWPGRGGLVDARHARDVLLRA